MSDTRLGRPHAVRDETLEVIRRLVVVSATGLAAELGIERGTAHKRLVRYAEDGLLVSLDHAPGVWAPVHDEEGRRVRVGLVPVE